MGMKLRLYCNPPKPITQILFFENSLWLFYNKDMKRVRKETTV